MASGICDRPNPPTLQSRSGCMEMGSGASLEPISAPGGACSRCKALERRGLFWCCGPSGCATPLPPRSVTPPSAGDMSSPRPGFAAPSPQAGRSWKENFHYRDRCLSLSVLQRVEVSLAELGWAVCQEAALQRGDRGRAAPGQLRKWLRTE